MHEHKSRTRIFALLLGFAALVMAGAASADPPSRVARLGYMTGSVSWSPAGENDWAQARINRPLTSGDRLWVDAGARAEIQVGGAMIRVNAGTGVSILNLDDRIVQLELTQGTLNIRVRRLEPGQVFEVATPNLAFVLRQAGDYRINVDPGGDATTVVVRSGRGEVYGDNAAYTIAARQRYRFTGTDLRQYDSGDAARFDEFDRWSSERDRRGAVSARYVSPYVIGYEDLDEYGSWRAAEGYGNVWMPNRVAADWAPYRDGHWAWVEPWGWTWVDDAPWGFAVSHYGRWASISGSWAWIPGPVRSRAVYAPALVAFIGGSNFQISISSGNVGGIAWFPLGPRDVYRPSYTASRRYFNDVNTSNTTINTTNITNVYNNVNVRNITYVNQQVPGAIVAVPSATFVQSQPVARAAVRLSRDAVATAPVTAVAAVAPVQASVHGAAAPGPKPPAEAQRRPVVAKAAPPPARAPFAARQPALAAQPGRPLDAAAAAAVKPTAPAPAPSVKVVAPAQPVGAPPKRQATSAGVPRAQEATKGRQPPEAQAPSPPVSAPRAQEGQAPAPASAPRAQEVQKGRSRDAEKAPPQPASAPKPPAAQAPAPVSAPIAQEAQKGRSRDAEKAPAQPASAPKPPQAQAPAPASAPRAQEAPKGRSRDAENAPPQPASAPKPPEAQAPAPVSAPRAQEVPKGRSREAEKAPPQLVSAPKPPAAQVLPPKPEAGKSAEKNAERKSDEQLRLEEKLKREEDDRKRKQ